MVTPSPKWERTDIGWKRNERELVISEMDPHWICGRTKDDDTVFEVWETLGPTQHTSLVLFDDRQQAREFVFFLTWYLDALHDESIEDSQAREIPLEPLEGANESFEQTGLWDGVPVVEGKDALTVLEKVDEKQSWVGPTIDEVHDQAATAK